MGIIALVVSFAALAVALAVGACMLVLHKGAADLDSLRAVLVELRDALKGVLDDDEVEGWLFSRLAEYAYQAVHAIQQRYHKGEITAEERKDAALELIKTFALTDGIMLDDQDIISASYLIEAECDAMGHSGSGDTGIFTENG